MYGSPPLSLDFSTNISEITKDFKAQIKQDARTKFDDKGNIVSSYYYDTKTKTLSNAHKSVIYNEVSEIVNNTRLQNDLWWQMTGQKGKFDFETEEIIKMQEHFYNQAVQQARASIEEEFTEKFDRTQAGVDSRARNNEEKPSYIITGIPDYEREYRDVNGLYVVKNPNSVEERFPLKDDVEVVPNVTGIRISNKETGEQETEVIKNFRLEKYFIDDEGNFVARGNKVTTLGESGSKETIGSDMESINIEDLRERRPAQTERISVILPLTEAGRVLASAGYNSEEIKSELDLMRSLQGTKSSVDETSKFNIEGEKKESSGFNLDEYLKEKGLK